MLHILAVFEMPVDVLDRHGGVIDQDADRERQAAERHDVEGLAGRGQGGHASTGSASGIEVAMITVERQLPERSGSSGWSGWRR